MDTDEYVKELKKLRQKAVEHGDVRLAFEILAEEKAQIIPRENENN